MRIFDGRAVIALATFLGVVACSTPDKRPPESAGPPIDAAPARGLSALGDAGAMGHADARQEPMEHLKRL